MAAAGAAGGAPVRLPRREPTPSARIGRRVLLALALILFVALVAYLDRDGYEDSAGGGVDLLEALYYATVSITTTGYGDIVPVTDGSRLLTTFLVTPARVLFLILLVGTTLELLAERTREAYELRRWRARLRDHVVICGFGTKGKSAVRSLLGRGVDPSSLVVIDSRPAALDDAQAEGLATVAGNAARTDVLRAAGIERASAVVVAPDRDDSAVLITLTARELNRDATIVAAAREEENAHLLRESRADSVITSSGAAGRLLGLAVETPKLVEVLEDLLSVGEGLDLFEQPVSDEEAGGPPRVAEGTLLLAVVRGSEILRFDDARARRLEPGDRLISLCSREDGRASREEERGGGAAE